MPDLNEAFEVDTPDGQAWVYRGGVWQKRHNYVHALDCARMTTPSIDEPVCTCGGAEVERVARAMVVARDYDPEQIASCESPFIIDTPYARVMCAPTYPAPLWTFFRQAAETAIKALRA